MYGEAKAVFERSVELSDTDTSAHVGLIRSLFVTGSREEAKSRLDDLLRNNPDNLRLVLLSGLLSFELGDFEAAKVAGERILGQPVIRASERKLIEQTQIDDLTPC